VNIADDLPDRFFLIYARQPTLPFPTHPGAMGNRHCCHVIFSASSASEINAEALIYQQARF
jgi:hypothetical protein